MGVAQETGFKLLDSDQFLEFDKRIARLASDRAVQVDYPFGVFNLELTNRCPLKCVMCPRTVDMTRQEGLMNGDLFRKVIDELAASHPEWSRQAPVRLHGYGESLVHPQFDELIRYAEQRGVVTGLSLNPIMLTDDVARRLLDAEPSLLYIALDGHDDASFAAIRGLPAAYIKSQANLLRFLERKKNMNSRTRVVLSMIDFHLNEASIERMREYWTKLDGLDDVRIKAFVTFDGNAESVNRLASIQPAGGSMQRNVTCRWPWRSMSVLWDGDVVPCCYDFDKRYVIGNVASETLSSLWNGPRMQALREEFASGRVTNPLCRNCPELRS
jgi:radical SAM protein with 4Fe4S-binding SPASM domain